MNYFLQLWHGPPFPLWLFLPAWLWLSCGPYYVLKFCSCPFLGTHTDDDSLQSPISISHHLYIFLFFWTKQIKSQECERNKSNGDRIADCVNECILWPQGIRVRTHTCPVNTLRVLFLSLVINCCMAVLTSIMKFSNPNFMHSKITHSCINTLLDQS